MHPHFLCKIIVSKLKKTPRERASEGASEHNCIKNRSNNSKNRSNKTETQLFGANTKSNENRNNKTETAHIFIRCNFGPLLFALVFAPPSCIGVRTLHLSRHLASVFAPCMLPLQFAAWSSFHIVKQSMMISKLVLDNMKNQVTHWVDVPQS